LLVCADLSGRYKKIPAKKIDVNGGSTQASAAFPNAPIDTPLLQGQLLQEGQHAMQGDHGGGVQLPAK
jgi:hypothetical protein